MNKKFGFFRVVRTAPPCCKCGKPTANFVTLVCQPCKKAV